MPALDVAALGARIRKLRERAGLTQAELAEAAGVSDETVSRIERGAFEPALSTFAALAEALGVSMDSLVKPWVASDSRQAPGSPLLRRLAARLESLDPAALSVLLRLALLLPTRAERGGMRKPAAP